MKKLLKPEMKVLRFDAQDVITTSGGGGDTVNFLSKNSTTTVGNAHDDKTFSGIGWNQLQ